MPEGDIKKMNCDNFFDLQFKEKKIHFFPWVGKKYQKQTQKILILGESHYYGENCSKKEKIQIDNNPYFTRECFENDSIQVYKKMESLLANNLLDYDWISEKVCFYNFFTKCVGYGSSDKQFIDEKLIKESRDSFFDVSSILIPDIVIVWGKTNMWDWMPSFDNSKGNMINDELYKYENQTNTYIFHIKHPSSINFDILDAAKFINEQFTEINKLLNKNIEYPLKKD